MCDIEAAMTQLPSQGLISKKNEIFSCSTCDYVTQFKGNLARHILLHADEKPFSCHLCKITFKKQHHLNSHVINHNQRKPHQCLHESCEYSCNSKNDLKRHVRTHTGEKPYKCYFVPCNYSSANSGDLKKHIYIHTGERPFRCSFKDCQYSCTMSGNLKTHLRTHTGSKPFSCTFNSSSYSCNASNILKEHVLRHLVKNPHKCPQCHFRFESSHETERHLHSVHNKPQDEVSENASCIPIPSNSSADVAVVTLQAKRSKIRKIVVGALIEDEEGGGRSPENKKNLLLEKSLLPPEKESKSAVPKVQLKSKDAYLCVICDFRTKILKKFEGHVESHWDEGRCSIVPKDTEQNSESAINPKKKKKLVCMFMACNFASKRLQKYKIHLDWHLETEEFFCSLCDFVCTKRKRFEAHRRAHADATLK